MPRTSKAEKISAPETEKIAAHIAITSEKSKDHADNEDSTLTDAKKELSGLFDGMGGGLAGKQASELAAKITSEELSNVPEGTDAKIWQTAIEKALEKSQEGVVKLGNEIFFEQLNDPFVAATYKDQPQDKIQEFIVEQGKSPAGTTASVTKMVERPDGSADLVFGHIGDSRIYVLKGGKELKRLTKDQGTLEEAVQNKYITKEEADFIDQATSKEEILKKFGPERGKTVLFLYKDLRRGVKSALGLSESKIQTGIEPLEPGDLAIITSDGIHDNLTDEEIRTEIMRGGTPAEISARLVKAAGKRVTEKTLRSKEDDKTAVVLEVPKTIEAAAAEELPSLTSEQIEQYRAAAEALREESVELQKLLPLAKHVEAGRPVLTSKEKKKKIAEFGVTGIEERLQKIEEDIISYEYALAQNSGDEVTAEKMKNRYQELQKEKLERLRARDKEQSASQIEKIKKAIGA
ncbi:protein phosphatase 2C domain-containing protein [Candidatus Falkowbacteria bacterium]|nr:protein phosphatase 2C domain-containing protein [Candidatus Falkowbacteria bacterium]